ncbi:MAG: Ig-like domain-containing protein [Bacteroidales bacterium]|nr:Ig-like domain-containing protein [Bacteroidales bacterium]
MKNMLKYMAVFFVVVVILTQCDKMNDLHDKYLKDGEIIYVAKFDSMKVFSGIERMVIHYWLSDPQVKNLEIKWDLGKKSKVFEVGLTTPDAPGIVEVSPITEGTNSFELINLNADLADASVATRFTIPIYGENYQKALDNRIIRDYDYKHAGDSMRIYWVASTYEGTIGTELTYFTSSGEQRIDTIARPEDLVSRPNPNDPANPIPVLFRNVTKIPDILDGSDLVYRVIYKPATSVDIISCVRDTLKVTPAIRVSEITLEKSAIAVEIRKAVTLKHTVYPDNAFNKKVLWSSSRPEVARVSTGMVTGLSAGYTYINVVSEDNGIMATCLVKVNAAGYVDLDRSEWYIAPETDMSDNPLVYSGDAGVPSTPSTIAFNTAAPVWAKKKSPYLSHFLGGNAGAAYPASGDARISPTAIIDNLSSTYLGMTKGTATDATLDGWGGDPTANWTGFHRWGGMWINTPAEKPWFIIRLSETEPQEFNYFRIRYRENGSLTDTNKPQSMTFFGSNDDGCITNEALWTKINDEPIVPVNANVTSATPPNTEVFAAIVGGETGNQAFPDNCEYRYIKVQFDTWTSGGNTICIAEFYLGYRDIDVAP